jgi:hypothetical protein
MKMLYRCPHLQRFRLCPAMHDGIVGIPFERQLRILTPHPDWRQLEFPVNDN